MPDHSTFSVNRHGRFRASDILRKVFEEGVRGCMVAGLVGGEGFAIDASVMEADASRFKRVEGSEIDWTDEQRVRRPIREYLDALDGERAARPPKALSPIDPGAAWTTRGRHKVMFGYSLNYLIDTEEAIIVDVEATPTRISKEVDATGTMLLNEEPELNQQTWEPRPARHWPEAAKTVAPSHSGHRRPAKFRVFQQPQPKADIAIR